jgi:hypothetical protein
MQVIGTNSGNDSIAIIGTASGGERTIGVRGASGTVGVQGIGDGWNGVEGISHSTIGGAGVFGVNETGVGVKGLSKAQGNPAILGVHLGDGPGVMGKGIPAGLFEGNVDITGNLTIQGVSIQDWLFRIVRLENRVIGIAGDSETGLGGKLADLDTELKKLRGDLLQLAATVGTLISTQHIP